MLIHETTTHRSRKSTGMVCWNTGGCCYHSFTFIGVPMKTQEDLYLEYARVITMVREYNERHSTDVKPWECVKHKHTCWSFSSTPIFYHGATDDHTFAIAILEGKPVFVGDVVYHKQYRTACEITESHIGCLTLTNATWTPPQKKRTFMLNGDELPCPKKTGEHSFDMSIRSSKINPAIETFCFNSEFDLVKFYNGIRAFLIQVRDKE